MRKVMLFVAGAGMIIALGAGVASASSPDLSKKISVGWWDARVPVGVQIGLAPKMALDLGVGFQKQKDVDLGFSIGGALPITLCNMDDKASFSFRPGVIFRNKESGYKTEIDIMADLEARVWLSERFSILAGHGLSIVNHKGYEANAQSATDIGTHAISATQVGFWYTWQ